MNNFKSILTGIFIIILTINGVARPNDRMLFLAIDGLAPALKFGLEKSISERLSYKASAGFCLVGPSLLSYNFFGTYIITKPEKAVGININFGFLDNYIDVLSPTFSLGIGGAAGVYFRFRNSSRLTLRVGMITGPARDDKNFEILTLPNFGIEYAFRCKNKEGSEGKIQHQEGQ